jgi:nucleosome binding factor SPN SPT16 subunit
MVRLVFMIGLVAILSVSTWQTAVDRYVDDDIEHWKQPFMQSQIEFEQERLERQRDENINAAP